MNNMLDAANTKVHSGWINLKSSLWFFPSVIVLLFSLSAILLIVIDQQYYDQLSKEKFTLFNSSPEGAREVLSTIASSMITVAGVVFSITIVALSLSSTQYSSRVLRNFMRDHKNQMVLGVFVGIFAYCLLVLRNVGGAYTPDYVPYLSVLFAVILSFGGIGVFVFFIHHIASSIQASQIISNIFKETIKVIDQMFPSEVSADEEEQRAFEKDNWKNEKVFYPVYAESTGYVQKIDTKVLSHIASQKNLIIRIEVHVGTFLIESVPFVLVKSSSRPGKDLVNLIKGAFTVERQRTIEQDPAYGIRQIVDIALKALSPGINDTTTAVMCVERLTAVLSKLTTRKIGSCVLEENKDVRVIINEPDFNYYMDQAFEQIRQHGHSNVVILRTLSWAFKTINKFTSVASRKQAVKKHMDQLKETVDSNIEPGTDKEVLKELCAPLPK